MANVVSAVTIDCADPTRLLSFWAALLDRQEVPSLPGWRELGGGDGLRINFQPVADRKRGKVRIHLDVTVDDLDEAMRQVAELGGRWTGERHDYVGEGAVAVMADPEDNEFCLVQYFD